MTKLKTSTKVLIALAASALILAIVLFFTMPEPWAEQIQQHHTMMLDGSFYKLADRESLKGFHNFRGNYHGHRNPHSFGGTLFFLLILFFIFRKMRYHGHGRGREDHSITILDELFALEKISEKEYRRRRIIIEEERK